jgi:hypothetical protein
VVIARRRKQTCGMRGARSIPPEVVTFFLNHGFGIVTTIDSDGNPHHSCKGIVDMNRRGYVYLIDLYRGRTYRNLARNCSMTITVVDEHQFQGYSLKGTARVARRSALSARVSKEWEQRLNHRLTRRIIRNIREDKKISAHPEALFPAPRYVIVMKVEGVLDLKPPQIRSASASGVDS